jgi:hypothetical protein
MKMRFAKRDENTVGGGYETPEEKHSDDSV